MLLDFEWSDLRYPLYSDLQSRESQQFHKVLLDSFKAKKYFPLEFFRESPNSEDKGFSRPYLTHKTL